MAMFTNFISLGFLFIFTMSMTEGVTIGHLTWNVAGKNRKELKTNGYAIPSLSQHLNNLDILFVGQQEAKSASKMHMQYKLFDLPGYSRKKKTGWTPGLGALREDVYIKTTLLDYFTLETSAHTLDSPENSLWKSEKQSVMLKLVVTLKTDTSKSETYCFINSHFETGYKLGHYGHFLELLNNNLKLFESCDIWSWGGDFNFRVNVHEDSVKNVVYTEIREELVNNHLALDLARDGIMLVPEECLGFQLLADKFIKHNQRLEMNPAIKFFTPKFYCLPPTFSRTSNSKCGPGLTVGIGAEVTKSKGPICLGTRSGGTCDDKEMICYAGDRGPTWTDIIFSGGIRFDKHVSVRKYGGYYGSTLSDHVPIFAVYDYESKFEDRSEESEESGWETAEKSEKSEKSRALEEFEELEDIVSRTN